MGESVSIGYFADSILTEKLFFKRKILGVEKRGYRTGDTGHTINGLLYYEGRIDNQIKLHGFRVEIEDIENNIRMLPFIENAVKNHLKDLLPLYMVPRKVKVVEALPINGNGKLDRKRIMEEF